MNSGRRDYYRNVEVAEGGDQYDRNWGFYWVLRPAGDDYWYIVNLTSGLYLTWDGNDRNVSAWGLCCLGDKQEWSFVQNSDSTVMIVNKASGEALDQADGGRQSDKNNVTIWPGQNAKDGGWSWTPKIMFPTLSRLRVMTIDSVKAISTSTGQDDATKVLFAGIDLAIQIGAAVASGGASAAAEAGAAMITPRSVGRGGKGSGKEKAQGRVEKQDSQYRRPQQRRSGARRHRPVFGGRRWWRVHSDRRHGCGQQCARRHVERIHLQQGLWQFPDDLDIRVNKSSIFPEGGRTHGATIKSQQTLQVGRSFIFYADTGVELSLWEYDYASRDDFMGGVEWKDPGAVTKRSDLQTQDWRTLELFQTKTYKDVLITQESEGSAYLVTFHIDALHPVGGQLEELQAQRDPTRRGPNYDRLLEGRQAQADAVKMQFFQPGAGCATRDVRPIPLVPPMRNTVVLQNRGDTNLRVFWLNTNGGETDFDGAAKPVTSVAPGKIVTFDGFQNYSYVLIDDYGQCQGVLGAGASRAVFGYQPVDSSYAHGQNGQPRTIAYGQSCQAIGNVPVGSGNLHLYWMLDGGALAEASAIAVGPGQTTQAADAAGRGFAMLDDARNCAGVGFVSPGITQFTFSSSAGGQAPAGQPNGGSGNAGQPAPPASPAPVAASTGACAERGRIASTTYAPPTVVRTTFTNAGQSNLDVYWIDDTGKEGDYQRQPRPLLSLTPGQTQIVNAYYGFAFLVVDQSGTCVAEAKPTPGDNSFAFAGVGGQSQVAAAGPGPVQSGLAGTAGGQPYTTALAYARAGGNTCNLEGKIASIDDPQPAGIDLHLENGGQGYLFVYWIDQNGREGNFAGAPQPVVNLTPGQYTTIQTRSGQAFMVRDQNGSCVGVVQANSAQTNYTF